MLIVETLLLQLFQLLQRLLLSFRTVTVQCVEGLVAQMVAAPRVAPQADIRELMHEMAQNTAAEAVVNGLRDWQAGCTDVDLTRISCAATVIGSSDAFLSDELVQREVVDKIPSATMVTMHSAGHYPLIEATASLARIIEEHAFRKYAGDRPLPVSDALRGRVRPLSSSE